MKKPRDLAISNKKTVAPASDYLQQIWVWVSRRFFQQIWAPSDDFPKITQQICLSDTSGTSHFLGAAMAASSQRRRGLVPWLLLWALLLPTAYVAPEWWRKGPVGWDENREGQHHWLVAKMAIMKENRPTARTSPNS